MSALKTFTGFKGVAMMIEVQGVRFIVVGKSELSLRSFHDRFLSEFDAFNPEACKKSIVIEAALLPDHKVAKLSTLKATTIIDLPHDENKA